MKSLMPLAAMTTLSLTSLAATYPNGAAKFGITKATLPTASPSGTFTPATLDNAGIQAAINAANAAGGGTVQLAAGTYNINAAVVLKNNITLKGAGQTVTFLRRGPTYAYTSGASNTSMTSSLVESRNASLHDTTIVDVTIDGNFTSAQLTSLHPGVYGVWVSSDTAATLNTRNRLHNVEVKQAGIGLGSGGSSHWTLDGGSYHNNGWDNFHNIYLRRCGYVNVQSISSTYAGGGGIKVAGGTSTYTGDSTNILIEKSTFNNCLWQGIYTSGNNQVRIANNTLTLNSATGHGGPTVSGGVCVPSEGGVHAKNVDIVNNIIQNNTPFNGVVCWDVDGLNIQGNRCNSNTTNYNITASTTVTNDGNTL